MFINNLTNFVLNYLSSPFVSTEFKLWGVIPTLQRKEVLNVPGVELGFTAGVVHLLNKQPLWQIISISNDNWDELDAENTAIVNEESRGIFFQCRERNHAWGPRVCAFFLNYIWFCRLFTRAEFINWSCSVTWTIQTGHQLLYSTQESIWPV